MNHRMELKKRFIQNNVQHLNEPIAGDGENALSASSDLDPEPGIPPRRFVHSKKQKKSSKFAWGYSLALMAILLVLGGSGWWMKSQLYENAASVSAPDVKQLEQNKEVPIEPIKMADETPKDKTQIPKDKNQSPLEPSSTPEPAPKSPTDVPPQQTVPKESKPAKVQKAMAKPSYKKIMRHKVGVGETLYRISLKYYQSGKYATFLARHNKLRNPSDLVSGTFVEIPYPPGK